MPLLKSQIIFVKKDSTQSIFKLFAGTHYIIFISYPISLCDGSFFKFNDKQERKNSTFFFLHRKNTCFQGGFYIYKYVFLNWFAISIYERNS